MAHSPRILVTASTFPRWQNDTEPRFVYELTKRLAKDFEVCVLCPYAKGSLQYEETDGMKIFRYRYLPADLGTLAYDGGILPKLKKTRLYSLQIPFFLLGQLAALKKIIETQKIDLVHAHWILPQGIIASLYKRLFHDRIKLVSTAHGGDIFALNSSGIRWAKQFVLNTTDRLTVVSSAMRKQLVEKLAYEREVYVYPMGVDTDLFHPDKSDGLLREQYGVEKNLILFVGRLAEKKGIRYLVEAMPYVLQSHPRTILLIVGGGVLKDELMQLSSALNVADHVVFVGPLPHDELPRFFATADVFVGPSVIASDGDTEGLGLVFAEAASCETLVVSTNLPAIADVIEDGETGFIVNQKDQQDLGKKIALLLENKNQFLEVRKKARQHIVQHFDWRVVASRYRDLINDITS